MIEVQKGIYRLDGELINPSGRPLILVHPWFDGANGDYTTASRNGNYQKNLTELLKSRRESNIFVFEESPKLRVTSQRISRIAGAKGRYFVETKPGKGFPLNSCEEDIANFLSESGYEFDFAGGYLRNGLSKGWPLRGCLGQVMMFLGSRGISGRTIEECCFIN